MIVNKVSADLAPIFIASSSLMLGNFKKATLGSEIPASKGVAVLFGDISIINTLKLLKY